MTPAKSNSAAANKTHALPKDLSNRSPLLDFPGELRNKIYDYTLQLSVTESLARSAAQEPALRYTCRQIRLETKHKYHHFLTAELEQTNQDIERVESEIKTFNDQLWQAHWDEANGVAGAESRLNSILKRLRNRESLALVQGAKRRQRELLQRMIARIIALHRTFDNGITNEGDCA